MWGSDWEYAAIYFTVFPADVVVLVKTFDGTGNGFYYVAPAQVPVFIVGAGPTPGNPHFPWGWPVALD